MEKVEGRILRVLSDTDEVDVVEGTLHIEDGVITEVTEEPVASDDIVMPAFVNAHTHIGDSVAKEAGRGLSLDERVAPPDGLKHRILRDVTQEEKTDAMTKTVEFMRDSGTGAFVDFREGGAEGVESLRRAAEGTGVEAVAMGRGDPSVLDVADGYGASGTRDGDFGEPRREARSLGKPFGIHAGERDADDIDDAFDLDPDFLVHMVHARDADLEKLEDDEIPVAVCPRSNLVTDVGLPPVEDLVEHTDVALGTDNVMLNSPSVWREMEFTSKLYDVSDDEVLRMATVNGGKLLGRDDLGVIEEGAEARLTVLGTSGELDGVRDAVAGVVRRAGAVDVRRVVVPS
ncbi:MAG: amidohydrolase family protein [Halobacteria archaeon]|nr:amidohydrolase family protein [Halobacteria archaeon]